VSTGGRHEGQARGHCPYPYHYQGGAKILFKH
jgi:hypothetical protein